MELTLYREAPILREERHLPASVYNQARVLLANANAASVFVSIRSMQYLAVIDAEEIAFVYREFPSQVQLAWQDFQRNERQSLDERIGFTVAYYTEESRQMLNRLMAEFPKAMQMLSDRQKPQVPATVLPFKDK